MISAQDYARLSEGAYKEGKGDVQGWDIDKELSNRNRTVYVNKDTGKAVIAFRGTSLGSKERFKDLGTDALLALGLTKVSSRFKNAKDATKKVIAKYGKGNVSATGHSLGGTQALYANKDFGIDASAFNPGVSPGTIRDSLVSPNKGEKATIYTTGKDPISLLSPLVKKAKTIFKVGKKKTNAHSLQNFL